MLMVAMSGAVGFVQFTHATQPDPLTFTVVDTLPHAVVGKKYSYHFCDPDPGAKGLCGKALGEGATPLEINPHGGTPPYTFKVDGVGLPTGLKLHTNGYITGTPAKNAKTGKVSFKFCVTDAVGKSTCKSTAVKVYKLEPLTYTFPEKIDSATIGKSYKYSFCHPKAAKGQFCGKVLPKALPTNNPKGGTPPYTFKVDGVGLPFGLALNLNGNITGKPKSNTPTGKRSFTICVTDFVGKKKCKKVAITVKKAATETNSNTNTAPEVTQTATVTQAACTFVDLGNYYEASEQQDYNFIVTASGTVTGPVDTEVKPALALDSAAWVTGSDTQTSNSNWTTDADYDNQFRRATGDPDPGTWDFSEEIRIAEKPTYAWPSGNDVRVKVNLYQYYGEGYSRGFLSSVYQVVTCAHP